VIDFVQLMIDRYVMKFTFCINLPNQTIWQLNSNSCNCNTSTVAYIYTLENSSSGA